MSRAMQPGTQNPVIVVDESDLREFFERLAAKHGFSDRALDAVQYGHGPRVKAQIKEDFKGPYLDWPELCFMVSNIPNSKR